MSHKVYRATYSSYQEVGCIRDGREKGDTIFVVDRNVNPHRKSFLLSYCQTWSAKLWSAK